MLNNYKGFRKIAEDKEKAIMAHPSGHQIVIAKSGLTGKLKKALKALPLHKEEHLAEGGEAGDQSDSKDTGTYKYDPSSLKDYGKQLAAVDDDNSASNAPDISNDYTPSSGAGAGLTIGSEESQAPDTSHPNVVYDQGTPISNSDPRAQMGESPPINPQPGGSNLQMGDIQGAFNRQQQAATEQGQAEAQYNKDKLGFINKDVATQAAHEKAFQDNLQTINKNITDTSNDIKNSHIDPDRYMKSLGVIGKIQTAIGLILGGYGGGTGHHANEALQALNDNINRDMEAQKAEMGKKENLLSAYYKQYGNMHVAENMYQATRAHVLAEQIDAAAAKAGSPLAMAQAANAKAQLVNQYYPKVIQANAIDMLTKGNQNGQQMQPANQLAIMQKAGLINEDQYKKATDDVDVAEKTKAAHESLDRAFETIGKQQTLGNRVLNPIQSKQLIDSAAANITTNIMASAPSKRYSQDAVEQMVKPYIQSFWTKPDTASALKQDAHRMIDTAADKPQTAVGLGIRLPKYQPTVKVVSPDGRMGTIPASQLGQALAQKYRKAE